MSIAFRKTIAALAFSEAAANVILHTSDIDAESLQSAVAIKKYCQQAYHYLPERLTQKQVDKFSKAIKKVDMRWEDGYEITGQKMISWCAFLLDEPRSCTKNIGLKTCLDAISEILMHILGILEEKDGGPTWEPIDEAHETFIAWRDAGWA